MKKTEQKLKKNLVSISVISYNYGRYLHEAIKSILNQTYKPIELVVVDDGSKDNTAEVAKKYPVQLIRQSNMGPCYAFNKGVKAGSGEYSLIVSADDKIVPTCVEEMVEALNENKDASFAYSDIQFFGDRNGILKSNEFDITHLLKVNYINGTSLMRRKDFNEVGGFDLDYNRLGYEDWDLWIKFSNYGKYGVYISKPLVLVMFHKEGSRNRLSRSRDSLIRKLVHKKYPLPYSFLRMLEKINKENELLQHKTITLDKTLSNIYQSRSWKLVSALRKIKKAIPLIDRL